MPRSLLVPLIAVVLLSLAVPTGAAAEMRPSSDVLLPYFEVDLESPAATTLFAVGNALDEEVPVDLQIRTNWGIPVLEVTFTLEPRQVRTFNLRDWLVAGHLPGRTLEAAELKHLAAALCGQRSTKDSLFYSSELVPGRAVGSIVIRTQGPKRPDALWGDYFLVDPSQDFAAGDTLANIDREACQGMCSRHNLRFLAGAAFDAGTEVLIWTDKVGRPSEKADYPNVNLVVTQAKAYDEAGKPIGERELDLLPVERMKVGELGLVQAFGWLDLRTEEDSFVGVRYSAGGRYSISLQSYCLPEELPPTGPAIRIEKLTNGATADLPPGPSIAVGSPVTWEYLVTNTGDVPLGDLAVTDDRDVAVSCPGTVLPPGGSMTCTGHGVAVACQYANIGTATGSSPDGVEVSASDPSHYFGVLDAAIDVELAIGGNDADSAPGPSVPEGSALQWSYRVSNTGRAALTGVVVTDDGGLAVSCPKATLQPGEAMTCTAGGPAAPGHQVHVGSAAGEPSCGPAVTDSDPAHYTSEPPPPPPPAGIDIEKATNGQDADSAPGPTIQVGSPVTWTYVVTNTGEVTLTAVQVADDQGVAVTCPKTVLQPAESMTCTGHGVAVEGQYRNVGTVTGNPPSGPPVSDTDPSHYFGESLPPPPPPPPGDQGCTPGYWKNHTDSWPATGYSPAQQIQGVFSQASGYPALGAASLHQGLSFQGGSTLDGAAGNLLRAAIAALLDSAHPGVDYPRATADVISDVNAALASHHRDTILGLASDLDRDNNLGCPLN